MQAADDYVRISFRHEEFRVAFSPPFVVVLSCVLVLSETFFLLTGSLALHVMLLTLPLTVALLSAVAVGVACLLFKFEVGPDGIKGYDFWSRSHRTDWDSVAAVQRVSLLGLDYLRLDVRGSGRSIWIPLFVERYDLLEDLLSVYLDDAHQLHQKLDRVAA